MSETDGSVEITIKLDRELHEAMQDFFRPERFGFFEGYQDFFELAAEAVCRRDGKPREYRTFLEVLDWCADQKGICLETLLYGRAPNEHDRLQLYSLLLGLDRLSLVNDYEQAEWRKRKLLGVAHDLAKRLARDLERDTATMIIEEKTHFDPEIRAEALHWLDIELAVRGKS